MTEPRVVVVGTSAGGLSALKRLVAQFPPDFPAAVFVVQHLAAEVSIDVWLDALGRAGSLPCIRASDGERFKEGHVYLAPTDHHLLVGKNEKIMVTKGARENRWRPAIDPLFRSAAVACGNRVVSVLLTGHLDDGTAGTIAVKRCGGTTVVQDPEEADHPDMPMNAIQNAEVDHVVPLAEMGALLTRLVDGEMGDGFAPPEDIVTEARIAERVLSDLESVGELGGQVPFNCPDCGGVLWQIHAEDMRYRCHTGHSFTAPVLLAAQTARIEETMWVALRMFEERRNLLMTMANKKDGRGTVPSAAERAKDSMVHIKRIRAMLMSEDKATEDAWGHQGEKQSPAGGAKGKKKVEAEAKKG
ncbi:MAG: chemotaxis protein CheB [Euryarchaeota archaeon]|nr:chemotaxis protein CheB [Euryarchaeota archaeon]